MRGVVFWDEEKVVDPLISAFEKLGIFMEKGYGLDAFKNLPGVDVDFLIVEFPPRDVPRKNFFRILSELWEKNKVFTIVIKDKSTGLRRSDIKEFITVLDKPVEPEAILDVIVKRLNIPTEEVDLLPLEELEEIKEKLEAGLSHYGVGKLEEAYKEWLEVLKMDNCNAKAIEYIKIAESDFKRAGIDLSEFRKLTSIMRTEAPENINLRGTDIFVLNENIDISKENLHPLEAFVLSNFDGKTPLKNVLMILPEEQKSCLKNMIAYFLSRGIIKKIK